MAIVTKPFIRTAIAMTEIDGVPNYPYIIAPHPLSSLTEAELRACAEPLARAAARVLLAGEGGEVAL